MKTKTYAVPGAIARELHLTDIRRTCGTDTYLLSAADLRPYGIARALAEGAKVVERDSQFIIHNS